MSSQGSPPAPFSFPPASGAGQPVFSVRLPRRRPRYWLHILLLCLTLLTTTAVGARMAYNFRYNLPAFTSDDVSVLAGMLGKPAQLVQGLPFSLTLLLILLAHEMGHYVACCYYRVDATLPFFLPAPTLIGTLGAFIRIRSPIYTKKALFDIGVALSKIIPGIADRGELIFGIPPIQHLLQTVIFPGVAASDVSLHPVARAAWVGALATALNLLPIGQLDGGHILYSIAGRRHKLLSRIFVLVLIPIGIFYSYSWLLWAAILFLLGMRHPSIHDATELGPGRRKLGLLALVIFVLSFTLTPVRITNGF